MNNKQLNVIPGGFSRGIQRLTRREPGKSPAYELKAEEDIMQNGYSLIEVLISLTLISLALFTTDALELQTLAAARETYYLQTAAFQIQNMTARLQTWVNQPNLEDNIAQWNHQNQLLLPGAQGLVTGQYPIYQIQVTWGRNQSLSQQIQLSV